MLTVGIETLKDKLGEYVRAAAAGETVQVTDGGKVVAELVPPRVVADAPLAGAPPAASPLPADATDAERQWAELIRQGIVTPAKIPPGAPLPPRRPSTMTFEEFMADLDESRSDR